MSIKELKTMKDQLMGCIQGQMGSLEKVDTKELGEAIDMIKDLSQAIYYCTITEAMEKQPDESKSVNNVNYYTMPVTRSYPDYRNIERNEGYMYYPTDGQGGSNMNMGNTTSRTMYTTPMRDPRQGRSSIRRRMYMEGKELHRDPDSQLQELETYLEELSNDVVEMIRDASPEEKATLHQKMTMLANKIN